MNRSALRFDMDTFDDDEAWDAVVNSDRRADRSFVYAVQTTGIYCRPSCTARTPRRKNVSFFRGPAEAKAAGFRPCKRCRPDHSIGSPAEEAAVRARRLIENRLDADPDAPIRLTEIADAVGLSASYLHRTFTQVVGCSPKAYATTRRIAIAKKALQAGDTVLAAAMGAGYSSPKPLYKHADETIGMTPGAYRRGGEGETIRYALFETALGTCLVAATDVGVCCVALGDDAPALVDELDDEFPSANRVRDDQAVGRWAEPVLRYLAGAPEDPASTDAAARIASLPIDVRGTAFQRRVWNALQDIPPGETRTYGEVAAQIGNPGAARAVAQACAQNRIALVVPCHRVIGSGGKLRGYRWGPDRKRRLLELEGRKPERGEASS